MILRVCDSCLKPVEIDETIECPRCGTRPFWVVLGETHILGFARISGGTLLRNPMPTSNWPVYPRSLVFAILDTVAVPEEEGTPTQGNLFAEA